MNPLLVSLMLGITFLGFVVRILLKAEPERPEDDRSRGSGGGASS